MDFATVAGIHSVNRSEDTLFSYFATHILAETTAFVVLCLECGATWWSGNKPRGEIGTSEFQ